MAETAKYALENQMGCGFMSAIFHLKRVRPKSSVLVQDSPCPSSKSPRLPPPPKPTPARSLPSRHTEASRNSTAPGSQLVHSSYVKRLAREPAFASGELSLTLSQQQKSSLYPTGNVLLLGHLGNLKHKGNDGKGAESCKGNAVKKKVETGYQFGNVYQNPTSRLNPDGIKLLGNDKYRQGKYEEALDLYEQAIAIDPSNPCYHSNKSAALMGLGRLLEAVVHCREAVRLDSSYLNAHCRSAKLYLRLGLAEKAVYHYKCSGHKARGEDIVRAESLKNCIERCKEARDRGDWGNVINENHAALTLGADSAPQIYAMKAEALMKLNRHEDAHTVVQDAFKLSSELYPEIFGSCAAAGMLRIQAAVYLANGRFDDAERCVQQALRLDPSNDVRVTGERVKAVVYARLHGNRLFKGSRFSEALMAYHKGLESDPHNSILLCNRAACRSKLGQYDEAVEDCTEALAARPSYTKARLRRANCNAKLEKWEAAIEDYEVLVEEMPDNQEVKAALSEVKVQLVNTRQNGYNKDMDGGSNFTLVSNKENLHNIF